MKWRCVRIDTCARIVSGATPKTSEPAYWDGRLAWATPKDLSDLKGAVLRDTPRKITKAGLSSCSTEMLPIGSVLFSSRAPIGHVAINAIPMATNQGFKSFVPDQEKLDALYLYYWLRANKEYLVALGNGATFKEVSKEIVSRIEIPLPPLGEQRRIAALLDKADTLRQKRRIAVKKLDSLTQSIFIEMFGDASDYRERWRSRRLVDLLEAPLRNGLSPSNTGTIRGSVLTLSAITGQAFRPSAMKEATFHTKPPEDQTVDERDLLICRGNGNLKLVGKGYFPSSTMPSVLFPDTMIAARISHHVIKKEFLAFIWNSSAVRSQVETLARTTNGTHKVNQTMLEGIELMYPPLEMQEQFSLRVRSIERLRKKSEFAFGTADAIFDSIQHRAFREDL